jgi:hypothetical protein
VHLRQWRLGEKGFGIPGFLDQPAFRSWTPVFYGMNRAIPVFPMSKQRLSVLHGATGIASVKLPVVG